MTTDVSAQPTPQPKQGALNRLRHGLKSPSLPPWYQSIERKLAKLRRQVENTLLDAKGQINLTDAASVQTSMQWQRHAELAARWLRVSYDDLSPTDRLTFSREGLQRA